MSPAGSGNDLFHRGFGAYVGHPRIRSRWWWPTAAWLTTVGVVILTGLLPAVIGYIVLVSACVFLGCVLGAHTGDPSGLKDHRQ